MKFFHKKIIFLNFFLSFLSFLYCDFSTIDGVLDFFGKNDYVKEVFEDTLDTNTEAEKAFYENDIEEEFEGGGAIVDQVSQEQECNSGLMLEEEFFCEEEEFMLWKKQYKRICFAPRFSEDILRVDHRYFEQ